MKRIVICCDGTWNTLGAKDKTNVARLSEAILGTATEPDGRVTTQIVYHLDGVGSGRGVNQWARAADRFLGGAFGLGLDALIEEAYRFLVLNYEPGDRIYLFGFSRGAYCARSLCGLIRRAGILERRNAGYIKGAMELYRSRLTEAKSANDRAKRFRAEHSSHVTTVPGERTWREENGLMAHPSPEPLRIAYLGVWDTVGSLGVPKGVFGRLLGLTGWFDGHLFHDLRLSPLLDSARHAVAIDERRSDFEPTLWTLEDLRDVEGVDLTRYPQHWFPGVHGAVGGGSAETDLAYCALTWILEGATDAGLIVDHGMAAEWAKGRFNGPISGGYVRKDLLGRIYRWRSRDRNGVGAFANVSDVARRRWKYARYRPKPLSDFREDMDGWVDPVPPDSPPSGGAVRASPLAAE